MQMNASEATELFSCVKPDHNLISTITKGFECVNIKKINDAVVSTSGSEMLAVKCLEGRVNRETLTLSTF